MVQTINNQNRICFAFVGDIVVYNFWQFQIDSSQIEVLKLALIFLFHLHWKNLEEFLGNTNIPADLNFWGIDLKFLHIVDNLEAHNLLKFQIDSIKIDPWRTHVEIEVKI